VQLDLTPEAAGVLEEVLDHALGDVREQIYKTEVAEYKTGLKAREAVIESLLQQLKATAS
jgi:hypothetical protein